jgi:hypothetical protein
MSTTAWKAVGVGLAFLFILGTGIWLSRVGRPHSSALVNVHKLIGLAAAVFILWTLIQSHRAAPLAAGEWIAGVVTGVLFLATGVTGGLVSLEKTMPAVVVRVHQIAPYLTALSTGVTLYLLLGRV